MCDDFVVKRVESMDEIHEIVEIQRRAWGLVDLEIVPTFEMRAVASVGVALVAIDGEGHAIGFIYGYHYFPHNHYSHMMAVVPEWHGCGVGFALKQTHRDLAIASEHRVDNIFWTVDPLLPNNAYLNFSKLGAVCSKYYVDYYGNADSFGLYAGLPTDRFLVRWPIRSKRVARRMLDYKRDRVSEDELLERSPRVNRVVDSRFVFVRDFHDVEGRGFVVEVPWDFQWLREHELPIALDWRLRFREIVVEAFDEGWHVIDYHSFSGNGLRRNYYEFSLDLPE